MRSRTLAARSASRSSRQQQRERGHCDLAHGDMLAGAFATEAHRCLVGRISREGALGILRMKVIAVRSPRGLVLLQEPATWLSIEPLPENDL